VKIKENDLTMTERDLTVTKHPIVEQMEKEWPEMTNEFKRLQAEQYELFCRKQHDYGPSNISVGTQLITEDEIKLSLTGLWFRVNDKVQRIKNLLMGNRESAVDEPLEDAFLDMSNYGIMATIVKNRKWGK
jgi:catalase (peroxidase I)